MLEQLNSDDLDRLTVLVSMLSLLISIFAIAFSWLSSVKTRNSSALSILHELWKDQKEFSAQRPKTLVAIDGANALKATAAVWKDAGVSKRLLIDVFFTRYEAIYNELLSHTDNLPDVSYSGRDLLTKRVCEVYDDMRVWRATNECT